MRILYVARRYWPAVGGVEPFIRQLARELASRHEVTVLAHRVDDGPSDRLTDSLRPPPPFEPFDDGGVRVEPLVLSARDRMRLTPLATQIVPGLRRYAYGRIRIRTAQLYASVVAPAIAASGGDADVVHMWGSDLVAAAAMRAARQLGVPSVITPFAHRGAWGDGPADAYAYHAADRVVGLLDVESALYAELGVPAERLGVCAVCSPGLQGGGGPELRERHGIDGPLVVFLGVRRPYKGFDLLLEAAPLVAVRLPDVAFAFLGPGPALDARAAGRARLLDVGPVEEDGKAAWLEAADVLCLPSRSEIFPVSILEAWSVGTPVVAGDLPTLRELVGRSGGGVVTGLDAGSLADTLVELLGDRDRLVALGRSGQDFWSANATPAAVAEWHERLYADLVGSREGACAA